VATKAFACASSAALTATERGMIPSLNLGRRRGSPRLVGRQGEEEEVMAACAWTGSPPASAPQSHRVVCWISLASNPEEGEGQSQS
jgi:hypothetical protein